MLGWTGRVEAPTAGVLIVLACALAGCGASTPPPSAAQVVGQITARVLTAKPGPVVTAENDPNHLLGRPGQYTSAALFTDDRVQADQRNPDPTSLDNGGKVEAFATADDAQKRRDYVEQIAKATPLAVEYDYVAGAALVRVSKAVTPAQAVQYQAALN